MSRSLWPVRVVTTLLLSVLAACHDGQAPVGKGAAGPLPEPRLARFVKLEEVTEWSGKAWGSVAELNLLDSTGATLERAHWTATADSSGKYDPPAGAIDGDPKSHWHSEWEGPEAAPAPPHWLVVRMPTPVKLTGFRYLPRQDGNANGAIAQYRFYISDDGENWGEPVSVGDFASLGPANAEKVVVFARQSENHPPSATALPDQKSTMGTSVSIVVEARDVDGDRLDYASSGLPPGLAIDQVTGTISGTPIVPGTYRVELSVTDRKAPATTIALNWTVQTPTSDAAAPKLGPGEIRFVRLEEVSEVGGNAWGSIAEFNLVGPGDVTLPRDGWVASADSSAEHDQAFSAIDGSPVTMWHSRWDTAVPPPPPHYFIVDLGRGATIRGFRYLPRQDAPSNGMIARFRFYASVDGVEWGKPLAEGDFSKMGAPRSEKTVTFK